MYHIAPSYLRLARQRAGLPQFVVAKRARMSAARLSLLERGYDHPTSYERAALARVLGVPPEDLFPVEAAPRDRTQTPSDPTPASVAGNQG